MWRGGWCVRAVSTLVGGALTITGATATEVAMAGQEASDGATGAAASTTVGTLSLLQMNLCLSGVAGCFGDARYPLVVEEAIGVIETRRPDAVTFNEACSGDVARIARETGYHLRFAAVLVRERPLRCVDPGGRGVFGNAVITRRTIHGSAGRAFAAQASGEERRWICVETARQVDVCTAHLTTRGSGTARTANAGQCVEFAAVLGLRDERGPVLAAGDFNRRNGCVPAGMSARSDTRAEQLPGRQHGYGSTDELTPPLVETLPAEYTDHDYLLVRASPLTGPPRAQRAGRPRTAACPPWSPERGGYGSGRSARSSRTCA
jgi:endonuclease/exonuclease/phosphatase family metal-dependent hydrolase